MFGPCKQGTDSSETPKSEHAEQLEANSTAFFVIREKEDQGLKWYSGAYIKYEPTWQVPVTIYMLQLYIYFLEVRHVNTDLELQVYLIAIFLGSSTRR